MAVVQSVHLEIVENQGAAAALVTYRLRGSAQDVQQHRIYREIVELIGVDEEPGEDGGNELIPGGLVFDGTLTFANTAVFDRPPRLLALPVAALDEDPGAGPFGLFRKPDEIRARVTLTQVPPPPVSADSNVVRRDQLVNRLTPV